MNWLSGLRVSSTKFMLTAYRIVFGIVFLYGFLLAACLYMFVLGFYAFSSTWAAPFVITPTSNTILDLSAKLVSSQQSLATLIVDRDRWQETVSEFGYTRKKLNLLDQSFQYAITGQREENAIDQPDLALLQGRKHTDNVETDNISDKIDATVREASKDLALGLATKTDVASIIVQARQSKNLATDNKITEVLMRDTIRQKSPKASAAMDALAREAELRTSIVQLDLQIAQGIALIASNNIQIGSLKKAIDVAKHSPYFLATFEKVYFGFVPYDNQDKAVVGTPVYACRLNMVICRKVGIVQKVFEDEEHIDHPIFKTLVRGFLVQIELDDTEAVKNKTLFLGNKPLAF